MVKRTVFEKVFALGGLLSEHCYFPAEFAAERYSLLVIVEEHFVVHVEVLVAEPSEVRVEEFVVMPVLRCLCFRVVVVRNAVAVPVLPGYRCF